ncbi:MAG: hypothetical protein Q9225_002264 [Loekoesia sp. 1 TL-2023]
MSQCYEASISVLLVTDGNDVTMGMIRLAAQHLWEDSSSRYNNIHNLYNIQKLLSLDPSSPFSPEPGLYSKATFALYELFASHEQSSITFSPRPDPIMTSHPSITVSDAPNEPPPSYDAATASHTNSAQLSSSQTQHRTRNGIPPEYRRSMEDEGRPLPRGWVRQYDPDNHHQFFVDTTRDPPRSIWHHPYDDDEYMNSLDPKERQRIRSSLRVPSHDDIAAESSDEDRDDHPSPQTGAVNANSSSSQQQPGGASRFGRKLKDKLTNTTHEQREEQRRQRAIAEQEAYERHRQLRQAMVDAMRSGQPQHIGKDRNGRDIYIEPPQATNMPPGGGYGYNPYTQGVYANPNARFIRPANPYGRPYGRGYGGGYGLPLAGGLMGGMLLGGMMGGAFGGDFGGGDFGGGGGF